MAQITNKERVRRLETQLQELRKPLYLLAKTDEKTQSITALCVATTGFEQYLSFADLSELAEYLEQNPACTAALDGMLVQSSTTFLQSAFHQMTLEDLQRWKTALETEGEAANERLCLDLYPYFMLKLKEKRTNE